jgi:hypothetical protein
MRLQSCHNILFLYSPALPPSIVSLTLPAGHHVEVGGMTSKKVEPSTEISCEKYGEQLAIKYIIE